MWIICIHVIIFLLWFIVVKILPYLSLQKPERVITGSEELDGISYHRVKWGGKDTGLGTSSYKCTMVLERYKH